MDSKAVLRSRLREKREKDAQSRAETPLVRYNELGQPFCKLCKVTIKSDVLWPAHLRSKQHQTAAEELKARALQGPKTKKPALRVEETTEAEFKVPTVPSGTHELQTEAPSVEEPIIQEVNGVEPEEVKDAQRAVPQGFFDNTDADMKARGLEVPKRDLQAELKEFQRSIEDDVKAVDVRELEEEIEEVEYREVGDEFEQCLYMDRVEQLFKRRKLSSNETQKQKPAEEDVNKLLEELSSEDDSDDDDWRVKRL